MNRQHLFDKMCEWSFLSWWIVSELQVILYVKFYAEVFGMNMLVIWCENMIWCVLLGSSQVIFNFHEGYGYLLPNAAPLQERNGLATSQISWTNAANRWMQAFHQIPIFTIFGQVYMCFYLVIFNCVAHYASGGRITWLCGLKTILAHFLMIVCSSFFLGFFHFY